MVFCSHLTHSRGLCFIYSNVVFSAQILTANKIHFPLCLFDFPLFSLSHYQIVPQIMECLIYLGELQSAGFGVPSPRQKVFAGL